jgi:predicted ATPase/DNA-binding winged helix-turn-helix (wHTH) protein
MSGPHEHTGADAAHPAANALAGPGGLSPDWTQNVAIRFDQFTLLPAERRLRRSGEDIRLGGRAYDILNLLIERAPGLVSKMELIDRVWPGLTVEEGNLRFQIKLLRRALGDDQAATRYVSTVPGRGYCFVANVSRVERERQEAGPGSDVPVEPKTNLPLPLHPIVGRERELAELDESLRQHRLVTLVGSGGVGKTRLAVELGRRILSRYRDGVWLVDLAPVSDPAMILRTTAMALDLSFANAEPTPEAIAKRISKRKLLLIFDNCEHLVDAVAELVGILVSHVGALTVLATSQESLRVAEEQIHRLEPLALAPAGATEIAQYGAVALFVELVRRVDRQFALSAENAESVAEICRRLDGVPLALEMAAARLPLLGIEGLRSGLAERLSLLRGDPRRGDRRHRTLRHVVEWSYGLLDATEQNVFRRLAAFPGSFSLEAAVAIMAPLGLDRWTALDTLWRLREKSLIVVEHGKTPRYRLLETLRLFAIEKLRASGDGDAVAERHARHFTEVFQTAEAAWETTPDPDWTALYRPEIDNLRAALDWALADPRRRQVALTLGVPGLHALSFFSFDIEGRQYCDRLLPLLDDDTPPAVAAGLLLRAGSLWQLMLGQRGLEYFERAVPLYRELDDRPRLVRAMCGVAACHALQGRQERATALLFEALSLHAQSPPQKLRLLITGHLGFIMMWAGKFAEARDYLTQSLQVARAVRSFNEVFYLTNLGLLEYRQGDVDGAIARGREALDCARRTPGYHGLHSALLNLAAYLLARDNPQEARCYATEAFAHLSESQIHRMALLQVWAVLAGFEGNLTEAAQLIGFVDAERARAQTPRQSPEQRLYCKLMRRLEAGLPAAELLARKAEGALWSEAEAIEFTAKRLVAAGPSAKR